MAKAIVLYESKYGNTEKVAETIVEGMNEVEGMDASFGRIGEVDIDEIPEYDIILVGSPNHFGKPIKSTIKFIDKLGNMDLHGKNVAVFDTYIHKWRQDRERAMKKLEERIKEKMPDAKLEAPGLSVGVKATKGPIAEGELPKCKEFGHRIADLMKR